jgi:hypothetical protein
MTARNLFLLLAAACVLSASGHLTAQAPNPNAPDRAQRLQALEDKMDRVLKLLGDRTPAPPPSPKEIENQIEMLTKARDMLMIKFEDAQREYQDFRIKSPIIFFRNAGNGPGPIAKQIEKEAATVQDLRLRLAEAEARQALVKKVGDSAAEARALAVFLQRRGVDVETLRKVAGGDNAGAQDMVRVYGDSLKLETEELRQLIESSQARIDGHNKYAREMNAYEVTEDRLRTTKEQSQKLLDVTISQLQKMEVTKEMMRQPKP